MKIEIASKQQPFSHVTSGIRVLLPGTTFVFTIHPALIEVDGQKIDVNVTGPILDFTVLSDIERQEIVVFGTTKKGYIRYKIVPNASSFAILVVKDKSDSLNFKYNNIQERSPPLLEKLSLGVHKKPDWELVSRRLDLKEILPHIFSLGQLTLPTKKAIIQTPLKNYEDFLELYLLTFTDLLVPHYNSHMGIKNPLSQGSVPLEFLSEFAGQVRDLFVKEEKNKLFILPKLFPKFPSGRMMNVKLFGGKILMHFEWSKKKIFKLILVPAESIQFSIHFASHVGEFRVRSSIKEFGAIMPNGTSLDLTRAKCLYLDRFQ